MTVISVTLIPSSTQFVSGIPDTIAITTDIPAMVFYTLDGTDPTTSSLIYVDPIKMPTQSPSVQLKVLATDGVSFSDILEQRYGPNISNARLPRAKATIVTPAGGSDCGSRGTNPVVAYSQPSDSPVSTYYGPHTAFDGYGSDPSIYPVRSQDYEIPIFDIKYSESDSEGQTGEGIGTLPAKTTIVYSPPPPEQSSVNSDMFNPKAMVIFHDGTKEVPDPNQFEIFKPYYEGEDLEKAMYGAGMYNSAFGDGNGAPSGGLVRYFYNQADNTVTFYYRDSKRNRWIISKEPYRQQVLANAPTAMSIYDRIVSPNTGDRHVYKWILWQRSALV